jgi:hypothetical protein
MIDDDKTGEKVQVLLQPEVAALIDQMPGWRQREYLFRYGPGSHNAIYKVLRLSEPAQFLSDRYHFDCVSITSKDLLRLRANNGLAENDACCVATRMRSHAFGQRELRNRLMGWQRRPCPLPGNRVHD